MREICELEPHLMKCRFIPPTSQSISLLQLKRP